MNRLSQVRYRINHQFHCQWLSIIIKQIFFIVMGWQQQDESDILRVIILIKRFTCLPSGLMGKLTCRSSLSKMFTCNINIKIDKIINIVIVLIIILIKFAIIIIITISYSCLASFENPVCQVFVQRFLFQSKSRTHRCERFSLYSCIFGICVFAYLCICVFVKYFTFWSLNKQNPSYCLWLNLKFIKTYLRHSCMHHKVKTTRSSKYMYGDQNMM